MPRPNCTAQGDFNVLRSNQLRMLLDVLGYVIERLRALALQATELAQVESLRIKLFKVAAVIARNIRRIRLYLASHCHCASVFAHGMRQRRSP